MTHYENAIKIKVLIDFPIGFLVFVWKGSAVAMGLAELLCTENDKRVG
jgi:hypothetical protein